MVAAAVVAAAESRWGGGEGSGEDGSEDGGKGGGGSGTRLNEMAGAREVGKEGPRSSFSTGCTPTLVLVLQIVIVCKPWPAVEDAGNSDVTASHYRGCFRLGNAEAHPPAQSIVA